MRAVVLIPCALAACALGIPGSGPTRIEPVVTSPGVEPPLAKARTLHERGDSVQALRALEPLLRQHPVAVEVERLRQDILRTRGRIGLLRCEAAARLASAPNDPTALYLFGRVQPAGAQQEAFRRAVDADPEQLWPWLGLAYAMRQDDVASALSIYDRLYAASGRHPVVGTAYAQLLRANGKLREAVAVYEQMVASGTMPGVGELGLAQTLMAIGGNNERMLAWGMLQKALQQRPYDPGVHAFVRELLRLGMADEQVEQLIDLLREDPLRWADFAQGIGLDVLTAMLARTGQSHAALAVLEQGKVSARMPVLRRQQRRLLLATGDVRGFLRLVLDDLPRELLDDESNQVRGLWLQLAGCGAGDRDPLATEADAVALCTALRDCGLLAEAEMATQMALRAFPAATALTALRDEVRRELAFEDGLRRLIYRGYADASVPSSDQFLQQVRELASTTLGHDVVWEAPMFSVPLIGELLDPFAAGLCLHLARYNHHLTLGRRSGGVTEGLLLTRLCVRDLPPDPQLPVQGRCREVVGCDREVRSLSGVLGGDLAGVALLNHYVIDYDAVREWAAGVADRRRIVVEDDGVQLRDPVPADVGPLDPLDVGFRLAAASPVPDSELETAVFDIVRWHERRHLIDSFHYLPLEANLWRGFGLLIRFGFSASAIEAEMERRAELATLVHSPHAELVLSHVADFLSESDRSSPHVVGFSTLGAQLVEALQAQGLDRAAASAANWHRLDRAVLQRAVQTLFDDLP
jgi:tetratricopeptide (TPR) repeat protein